MHQSGWVDTDIQPPRNAMGIPRNSLKVGAPVGFKDKYNNELFGEVIRLNPKTATVKINEGSNWIVPYQHLFRVIEGGIDELQEHLTISHNP